MARAGFGPWRSWTMMDIVVFAVGVTQGDKSGKHGGDAAV
jgi:hypothetical protein